MIRVFPGLDAVSAAVAEVFVEVVLRSARAEGRRPGVEGASVALAGGSTPRRAYQLLASPPWRERVAWDRVHIFWGDERCVPPSDPRSNERMAREALLDRVPIPPGQVHPIRCGGDSAQAAREYEALLLQLFGGPPRFDLILLGLGADGHTASLKPHTAALGERERQVVAVPDLGEGFDRVTLTAPAINRARRIVFAVSGAAKASALRAVLEGPPNPNQFPAQLIRPEAGEVVWLVDEAAAGGGS